MAEAQRCDLRKRGAVADGAAAKPQVRGLATPRISRGAGGD